MSKFCGYCGKQLDDTAEFCNSCGTKITNQTEPLSAPRPIYQDPAYAPPVAPPKKSRGGIIASIITVVVILLIALGIVGGNIKDLFKTYEEGTLTDTSYESEFIGVKFEVPDDWAIEKPDRSEFGLEDNTYGELVTGIPNKEVILLAVVEGESPLFTETTYLDGVKEELSSAGYENIEDSYDTISVAGEKYKVLSAEIHEMGESAKQSFCARKIGKYVVVFLVTQQENGTPLEELLSDFKEY